MPLGVVKSGARCSMIQSMPPDVSLSVKRVKGRRSTRTSYYWRPWVSYKTSTTGLCILTSPNTNWRSSGTLSWLVELEEQLKCIISRRCQADPDLWKEVVGVIRRQLGGIEKEDSGVVDSPRTVFEFPQSKAIAEGLSFGDSPCRANNRGNK